MEHNAYRTMAEIERHHWWFLGRRNFINENLKEIISSEAKILEVGCGTGGNLDMLSKYGSVTAMEIDDYALEIAADRSNVSLYKGSLPIDHPFEPQTFDFIVLFDVLEHIEDDLAALLALKKLLKPNGRLILTVPAYQFLWSEHDVNLHHFRRYSRGSLSSTIKRSDFQIEKMTNFNFFLLPIAIVVRLSAKLLRNRQTKIEMQPNQFINSILGAVFRLENLISRGNGWPLGLSIFAVLK